MNESTGHSPQSTVGTGDGATTTRNLSDVKRVVIKVGTSSLTYPNGNINLSAMEKLVRQAADLAHRGLQVILVSSGAIAAGVGRLGLSERPTTIPGKQAAAAVGQGLLMQIYEKLFAEYGKTVAQMLLTKDDLTSVKRRNNCHATLQTLLDYGVIPIVNENDTVAVDEIKLGDNDTLSAMVAAVAKADLLILLSDIDGLFSADPRRDANATIVRTVVGLTPEIERLAGGAGSSNGTGGMVTKLSAARITGDAGVRMIIANSSTDGILSRLLSSENLGTIFYPSERKQQKASGGDSNE